jgi:hypothetical protein
VRPPVGDDATLPLRLRQRKKGNKSSNEITCHH